ncbi:MAG: PQQ-binding-like beta-propeller repeat protein [Verrucomicrobia bacterium]|nr:PQQ-binding-like beta-propeller repeat protein [Verrucomicrobiota bacterium]
MTPIKHLGVLMRSGLVVVGTLLGLVSTTAGDWPQYRGPHHDGSSSEPIRTDWTVTPPTVVWKKSIDPAWSSMTVSDGRVFTQVNRSTSGGNREMCVALDANTGNELWASNLDIADYPDGGTGSTDGPRSTPTVEGDRVYVLTSYLQLYCLRATNGTVVWKRDFLTEFPGTSVINWQNAASPLVVGDLIFLNSNVSGQRLMAVRKSDGVTVWNGQNDTMTHATPAYVTLGGVPQIMFLTMQGLVGVVPETGSVLWRHTFTPSGTSTAATPIAEGDIVYASCAYAQGAWTARVTKPSASFTVAQTDFKRGSAFQNHWSTPVAHEGHLYSVVESGLRSLTCFSLTGRTNRWITSQVGGQNPGYASLIKVGGKLLILTERGRLVLAEPNPEQYTEIAYYQALSGKSWNHPAFSNGRIYARSSTEIVALDVSAAPPPLPPLSLKAQLPPSVGILRVEVEASNGTTLDSNAADRVQLWGTPGLGNQPWNLLEVSFIPSGGKLQADIPVSGTNPTQFLQVRERNP